MTRKITSLHAHNLSLRINHGRIEYQQCSVGILHQVVNVFKRIKCYRNEVINVNAQIHISVFFFFQTRTSDVDHNNITYMLFTYAIYGYKHLITLPRYNHNYIRTYEIYVYLRSYIHRILMAIRTYMTLTINYRVHNDYSIYFIDHRRFENISATDVTRCVYYIIVYYINVKFSIIYVHLMIYV